jgi:hypothetical protein
MSWNPEQDPQRRGNNNPETKPEFPPKHQPPSEEMLRKLGQTAINPPDKK